jgi:hypothetical protein
MGISFFGSLARIACFFGAGPDRQKKGTGTLRKTTTTLYTISILFCTFLVALVVFRTHGEYPARFKASVILVLAILQALRRTTIGRWLFRVLLRQINRQVICHPGRQSGDREDRDEECKTFHTVCHYTDSMGMNLNGGYIILPNRPCNAVVLP